MKAKSKKKVEPEVIVPPAPVVEEGKTKISVSLDADVVFDLTKLSKHPAVDRSLSYVINKACIEYRDECKKSGLI